MHHPDFGIESESPCAGGCVCLFCFLDGGREIEVEAEIDRGRGRDRDRERERERE
jgi:hypothetical protein